MPPWPYPAEHPYGRVISSVESSMHPPRAMQTSRRGDLLVIMRMDLFIAAPVLGIVMIYGPQWAAPLAALAVPLSLLANRSGLNYRRIRLT